MNDCEKLRQVLIVLNWVHENPGAHVNNIRYELERLRKLIAEAEVL